MMTMKKKPQPRGDDAPPTLDLPNPTRCAGYDLYQQAQAHEDQIIAKRDEAERDLQAAEDERHRIPGLNLTKAAEHVVDTGKLPDLSAPPTVDLAALRAAVSIMREACKVAAERTRLARKAWADKATPTFKGAFDAAVVEHLRDLARVAKQHQALIDARTQFGEATGVYIDCPLPGGLFGVWPDPTRQQVLADAAWQAAESGLIERDDPLVDEFIGRLK